MILADVKAGIFLRSMGAAIFLFKAEADGCGKISRTLAGVC